MTQVEADKTIFKEKVGVEARTYLEMDLPWNGEDIPAMVTIFDETDYKNPKPVRL
jgi:hypothetical protein